MIRVGVTGGIGSGKSTVCQLFSELGVPVYNCDSRGRELMDEDGIRSRIFELLGTNDRAEIARKVFSNSELLRKLEAIVHPAVVADLEKWFEVHREEKYVVAESAILFESGFNSLMDSVLVVTAPLDVRIARSGFERDDFMRRVASQMTDEERAAKADYVIDNSLTVNELRAKIEVIDKLFRQ